jgi:excisionase family DNA binding protein
MLAPDDHQGLDKPVYTVAEVASILRTSRSSICEMVRRGIKCIRMGRRMIIPRTAVLAILSGDARLNDREVVLRASSPLRQPAERGRASLRTEVPNPVGLRRKEQKEMYECDGCADDLDPEVNIISKLHQLQPVFL